MGNDSFKVEIQTYHLLEYQDFIDNAVKDIFDYPECRVVMDEFIIKGYKRVVYEVKNTRDELNIIQEKLERKLKSKIKDVEIEISALHSG